MSGPSAIFILGLLCGATGLIALFSLLIGKAYRGTSLWWLALTLVVGMLPVLAALKDLEAGRVPDVQWSRPAAWAVIALACWSLRDVLGQSGSLRLAGRSLLWLTLLTACGVPISAFLGHTGLSILLGPLWLAAVGVALHTAWVRHAPWIYWLAAGQVALVLGWAGLLVLQMRGGDVGDMQSFLWKALQLALYGATTYIALVWRSRLRSEVSLRVKAIERVDPLTGLALPRVLAERVEAAGARAREFGYRNALLGLQITNLKQLAADHALDNDELALVAASRAISAVLRDVDLAARVANNRFVVLVEGLAAEDSLSEAATRFVASGLRGDPVRGLRLAVKFQCVALEFGSEPADATALLDRLAAAQAGRPPADQGTAIRLLDPVPAGAPAPAIPPTASSPSLSSISS